MSAPPDVTLKDLSGKWVYNKKLTGDTDDILVLQGIGWLTRKAIRIATITLHIAQYTDEDGVVHIDIRQTLTGGFEGTKELRSLNWIESSHEDHIFGKVRGKSRFVGLQDIEEPFLKSGWLPEMNQTDVIQSYSESVGGGWKANQIWGFEEIEGQRRYVRHVVVTKGKDTKTARLVYDFVARE